MKYVIVRCEDDARVGERTASLLEGAKASHLQHLAQAGAAGQIRARVARRQGRGTVGAVDRIQLHRSLLGVGPGDPEAAPGPCYAASADLDLTPGATAWCCDFVTQQEGTIVDPTAGRIQTKESEVLLKAIGDRFGSEAYRWVVGRDAHHVLIDQDAARGGSEHPSVPSPEALVGQSWKRGLPKSPAGKRLRALIEDVAGFLESHPVNRVRVDLGENPANLLWIWGGAPLERQRTFSERTGLSGAVCSSGFFLRGCARLLDLRWHHSAASLEAGSLKALTKHVEGLFGQRDFVYVHLAVESPGPVERLCAIERIDQLLLRPATEALARLGPWRLLVVMDDLRTREAVPFIAIGTGLTQQPVMSLNAQYLAESPLTFADGASLFSWFTKHDSASA